MILMHSDKSSKPTFADEICSGLEEALANDKTCIILGLGVTDPKSIFGTVKGLFDKFGADRVIETPTSENGVTGIGIGLAISGFKPIMIHQRLDFFLLAMDQLVNNAAKWNFMFGGQQSVPLTIRLITGRGWGQGPTHSQNLHSWFTHIPGLKVVMPAFAKDVKNLLFESIKDPNPVIFIEDRWCHVQIFENLNEGVNNSTELGRAEIVIPGENLTIISAGFSTIQSFRAVKFLNSLGLGIELIDLKTLKPLDIETILNSVRKTHKVLVVDSGPIFSSFASEIVSQISRFAFEYLKQAPCIIAAPDTPEPASPGLTRDFKFNSKSIALKVLDLLGHDWQDFNLSDLDDEYWDVPNDTFKGPF